MATPPPHNLSSQKTLPPGRFNPSKVYRRKPPFDSPDVKTLFHGNIPFAPMAHPWEKGLYKPLNMAFISRYTNTMPKETNKWLPNFLGNNVVTVEEHLYAIVRDMENKGVEREDVAMKLMATSLTEYSQRWFKGLPNNHLASYEYFSKLFKSIWETNKDSGMLKTQFIQIKNKENETMSEFDTRFDKLHSQIPKDLCPSEAVCLLYVNAFEWKFCFILRDKKPTTLAQAKEYSAEIQENVLYSKIDHFSVSLCHGRRKDEGVK
jgi:hypothetical protein